MDMAFRGLMMITGTHDHQGITEIRLFLCTLPYARTLTYDRGAAKWLIIDDTASATIHSLLSPPT